MRVLRESLPIRGPGGEGPGQAPTGREVAPSGQAGLDPLDLADLPIAELVPEAERERLAELGRQPGHLAPDGLREFPVLRPLLRRPAARGDLVEDRGLVRLAVAQPLAPEVPPDRVEPRRRRD